MMANPIFNALGGAAMGGINPMQMVQKFWQNPTQLAQYARQNIGQLIMQRRFNVPQNIMNNPDAIAQYLMNSGQVSQEDYNQARQKASQFRK